MSRRPTHQGFAENDPVQSMSVEGKVSESANDLIFQAVKIDKPALVRWWDRESPSMVEELKQRLRADGIQGRIYSAAVTIFQPVIKHAGRIAINRLVSD